MKPHIFATLLLLPLMAACGQAEVPAQEEARPVRSVIAGADDRTVGATYSGQVRARYESRLAFQISGRVTARLVEVGSHVRRGQTLMRLDPEQEALQVESAAAEVAAARHRVADRRVDLSRTEALQRRNFASQAEVDQQRLALQEAELQLESALAQHALRLNQRGYTELVADRDGLVTALNAEVGQVVSPGQAVATVAADGEREVLVSIPESRVDELRRAGALEVSLWAQPQRRYAGQLRELAPDTDSVTRTYAARIAVIDADDAVMLGMTASVFARDAGSGSAMRLPLTAIHDRDGRSQVWIVDSVTSRVTARAVTLGAAQGDSVIVQDGVARGETVVTAGVHMLHDGQKVIGAGDAILTQAAAADSTGALP